MLNLYTAYSLAGKKGALWSCSTALGDGAIKKCTAAQRNYVSLFSFWGMLSYKSIEKIHSSEKIPYKYKIVLDALLAGTSIYMAIYGEDFFDKKYEAGSTKLAAKYFDDSGAITRLEEEYSKGYYPAIKFSLTHPKQLLANEFLHNCLLDQVVNITTFMFLDHYAKNSSRDTSKLVSYFSGKDTNINFGKTALNLSLNLFIQVGISTYSRICKKGFYQYIKNEVSKRAAYYHLDPDKAEISSKLESEINNLSREIPKSYELASQRTFEFLKLFLMSGLYNSPREKSFAGLIENYAPLVLTKFAINTYLKGELNKIGFRMFYSTSDEEPIQKIFRILSFEKQDKFGEILPKSPAEYSPADLRKISGHGGYQFMRKRVSDYYDNYRETYSDAIDYPIFMGVINDLGMDYFNLQGICLQSLWLKFLDIPADKFPSIESTNIEAFNLINNEYTYQALTPKEIEGLYMVVSKLNSSSNLQGINRIVNLNLALEIMSYKLYTQIDNEEPNLITYIDHIKFEPGKIYGICSKTSFKYDLLADIAGSLDSSVFSSVGDIAYPSLDGEAIPKLFCSSACSAIPAKNLYEQLTYRLPEEFLEQNKFRLMDRARELFNDYSYSFFDSNAFLPYRWDDENMSFDNTNILRKVNSDVLSTGDNSDKDDIILTTAEKSSLNMIISAILYKEYINKPVLLLMEDVLSCFKTNAFKIVVDQLKHIFSDSVIISCDNPDKTDIYDEYIRLEDYTPNQIHEEFNTTTQANTISEGDDYHYSTLGEPDYSISSELYGS
jgi:hypothetical protein